jgi:hypothetical protein
MRTTTKEHATAIMAAGLLAFGLVIAPAGGVPAPPDGHGGGNGGGGGGGGGEDPTPTHTFQSLATLSGTAGESNVNDIDELGRVVGRASGRAFLIVPRDDDPVDGVPDTWFIDDGSGNNALMVDLGVMNGQFAGAASRPTGINNQGYVVGGSDVGPGGDGRAFLIIPADVDGAPAWFVDDGYGGNALMIDLTGAVPEAGLTNSGALAVNDAGHVVGCYWSFNHPTAPDVDTPFIVVPEDTNGDDLPDTWFHDGNGDGVNDLMISLDTREDIGGWATHVNADGWVIGVLANGGATLGWFAVIPVDTTGDGVPDTWYDDADLDGVNDLLFELPSGPGNLNDLGQVVMDNGVWQLDPVLGATLLYDLEEVPNSMGEGGGGWLNNEGGVVGSAFKQKGNKWSSSGVATPLYWTDGVLHDLFDLMTNDDGIESARAAGIDDRGRIYGHWLIDDTFGTAFIAVPIPPAP